MKGRKDEPENDFGGSLRVDGAGRRRAVGAGVARGLALCVERVRDLVEDSVQARHSCESRASESAGGEGSGGGERTRVRGLQAASAAAETERASGLSKASSRYDHPAECRLQNTSSSDFASGAAREKTSQAPSSSCRPARRGGHLGLLKIPLLYHVLAPSVTERSETESIFV